MNAALGRTLAVMAGISLTVTAQPALAQAAAAYFINHAAQNGAPRQLSDSDRSYYGEVFRAIDAKQWGRVQELLAQRDSGLLHDEARAEFYLAANSPRVELQQIENWLQTGRNLPKAAQLARLGQTRGAQNLPDLPYEQRFQSRGGAPKRTRPSTVNDGTMPGSVREQILDRIVNDDPSGAQQLLVGVEPSLSSAARAEWRQRVAWSYYIENMDPQALALALTTAEGSGAWVAEGEWTAGLAAWRMNDCATASAAFQRAAYQAENPELRAAANFWGSRAALRCRQPDLSAQLLGLAAGSDQTLYGMLAAEQLGRRLPDALGKADLSAADWQQIGANDNVRVAVALSEIGQDNLASEVLLHQAKIGDPRDYAVLSRLARDLGLPSTQLYMGYNAPDGADADPSSLYPSPRWAPVNGWRVDPALAYAHALQESNFRASAVSPADARGLMQITPITVREHAPRLNMSASQVDIFDPAINLAFGQQNLEMLRDSPATQGYLPRIMAAYNAGLSPITRWKSEVIDQGDPLLYMESIPYWETRSYVAIVMRNYWMYERQANSASPSRISLAQNSWPLFPGVNLQGTEAPGAGRVFLSTGGR